MSIAGELVVDLRAYSLDGTSTTWANQDTTGNTAGNSDQTNEITIPFNATHGSVFFRLVYP